MGDQLSMTFRALADPTRRGLLAQLALHEAGAKELAEPYDMSLAAVSKHLRVLEEAGLIRRGRKSQWRPCSLQAEPLCEAADWLESFRRFWDTSLDRLGAYLKTLPPEESSQSDEAAVRTERKE